MMKTHVLIENAHNGYIAYIALRHHSINGKGNTRQNAVDNLLKAIKEIDSDFIKDGTNGLYDLNPDKMAVIDKTND